MTDARLLRVLIVEDAPDDEELVLMELEGGGYRVEHERVETELSMRSALERREWDVILSDYSLPSFSGSAALELLKRTGLDIPFIIVSGTVGEEAAVAAMRSGADDYVLKRSLGRLCPAVGREVREAASRAHQRKLQEHLLLSDRMASIGTLAAGVAHEINNPLAAIIANLQLAAEDLGDAANDSGVDARIREALGEIRDAQQAADRLRHIVRDLKIFSRPAEEATGPVDIRRVLDSSIRMAWNEIRHRARLIKAYGDVPPVTATETRLGQVFLNLIVNASQAIRAGDAEHNLIRVETRTDPSAGMVVAEVQDTGSGIAPENLRRIFDAFFTTKPIGVGTGLGLSICRKIVTGFGGAIEVDSQVGSGTTFRVLLPASAEMPGPQPAIPAQTAPRRRGQVLIVDDEAIVTKAVARALGRDHQVAVETSARLAVGRLQAGERFDVILCDLMMPQMTGMEFHAKVLDSFPEQADSIVFMTGGVFTPEAMAFLDAHADRHVEKPLDMQVLRSFVNELVI